MSDALSAATVRTGRLSLSFLARHLQALIELDAELERFGGTENACKEAQAKLSRLRQQEEQSIAQAEMKAAQIIRDAEAGAAQIVHDAEASADMIKAAAVREAEQIKVIAESELDDIQTSIAASKRELRDHQEAVFSKKTALGRVEQSLQEQAVKHREITDKIIAAHGEHTRIMGIIADAKARLG